VGSSKEKYIVFDIFCFQDGGNRQEILFEKGTMTPDKKNKNKTNTDSLGREASEQERK
jgi:hypothetical protein